jgi:hypothetical protein
MTGSFECEALRRLPLAEAVLTLWRWCADANVLNGVFDRHRGACYENQLSFALLVQLIADALIHHDGSGRKSCSQHREQGGVPVSDQAIYQKLSRLPPAVSEAFLADLSTRLLQVAPPEPAAAIPESLRAFRAVIIDGKVVKRVPKRLRPLRGAKGGVLGGKALVALDLAAGLVLRVATHADGEVNDCRLVPDLLPQVRAALPGETLLWVADRQFADLNQIEAFTADGGHFLVRYHSKTGFTADPERPARGGRDARGRTWTEEWGWLGRENHRKRRYVRRITLPRPDAEAVILLTDLLDGDTYPATDLLELYLARWGIERVFQKITEVFNLRHLIGTTPQGTLFQLSFCFVLYNSLQVVRGYVAESAKRPVETISTELLFDDVRRQLIGLYTLVPVATVATMIETLPTAAAVRARLRRLLADVWRRRWRKAPSRKRAPQKPTGKRKHTSVHRVLEADRLKRKRDNPSS